MSIRDAEVLKSAESFFFEYVRPIAQDIDGNPEALREAYLEMGRRDLLAVKRPLDYGGPAISEAAFRSFQEMSARVSGALSFLMTQHQSACSLISKSSNDILKSKVLPLMSNGQLSIGIGISQLRRAGVPMMRALRVEEGYVLNGEIPWITGFGVFQSFVVGARLESNEALFAIIPFAEQAVNGGGLTFSTPMRLAAMESAQTVTARVENWFVSDDDVVMIKPADWPETNDMINIVLQGHFAIGCAQAGIDIVRMATEKRKQEFVANAAQKLQDELEDIRLIARAISEDGDGRTTDEKLRVRARAIHHAVRCAHAAVAVSSGAANSLSHPAQRVYREALVYTVSAQTTDVMRATIEEIV